MDSDLLTAGEAANLKPPKAKAILRQVRAAAANWRNHAESAGVSAPWSQQIQADLRLDLPT